MSSDSQAIASDAERGFLASILDNPDTLLALGEVVSASDFSEPKHQMIYQTIQNLFLGSQTITALTVANALNAEGELSLAGGYEYLLQLMVYADTHEYLDTVSYAEIIQENARRASLSLFGQTIAEKAQYGSGYTSEQTLDLALDRLHQISEHSTHEEIIKLEKLLPETFADIKERGQRDEALTLGVPSGFVDLDAMTTGFHGGQFIIVAARPGIGKSTFALDISRAASLINNKTTLFFSLEMGRKELAVKILSATAKIETDKIKKGKVSPTEMKTLELHQRLLSEADLYIDDNPNLSLVSLRAKCLKQKATPAGLDLVIVDYLQLMETTKGNNKDDRQVQVSALSRGIKLLAKELNVPFIVLCQLNREAAGKKPAPDQLRESGSLEQDADMVLLLSRSIEEGVEDSDITELIVGKHRGGPTGTIRLISLLEFSKFANAAGRYVEEAPIPSDEDEPPHDLDLASEDSPSFPDETTEELKEPSFDDTAW